uniref:Uncharacterized protein n=1 Tax=Neovison vison TaxID=452646 RepID=A0A8C7B5M5_NEOVI
MEMILPRKAMATQELTVKRKLSENTLQLVILRISSLRSRIPIVALHMIALFDATTEQLNFLSWDLQCGYWEKMCH